MSLIAFATSEREIPADVDRSKVHFVKDYQQGTDVWTWPTHEGLCLRDTERNGYNDSDFYMEVWNPITREIDSVCFATTRGWTYPAYGAFPDATEETLAAVYQHRVEVLSKIYAADALEVAKVPQFGDRVRVTGGRKVAKGTEAEVFWLGNTSRGPFGFDNHTRRVGLRMADGSRTFVSEAQIEVLGWETRVPSDAETLRRAEVRAKEQVATYRACSRAIAKAEGRQ